LDKDITRTDFNTTKNTSGTRLYTSKPSSRTYIPAFDQTADQIVFSYHNNNLNNQKYEKKPINLQNVHVEEHDPLQCYTQLPNKYKECESNILERKVNKMDNNFH